MTADCSCHDHAHQGDPRDTDARALDLLQGDLRALLDMIPPGPRSSRPSRESVYARVIALIALARRISGAGLPPEHADAATAEAFRQWRSDRDRRRP